MFQNPFKNSNRERNLLITFLLLFNLLTCLLTAFLVQSHTENVPKQPEIPEKLIQLISSQQSRNLPSYETEPESCLPSVNFTEIPPKSDPNSGNYIYAIWWPPALALEKPELRDKAGIHRKWLIHGLWPQVDFEHSQPAQAVFDFNRLPKNVHRQLTKFMPNLVEYQEDYIFWQRAYNDFGRWSRFNTSVYFEKLLNVYETLELSNWQKKSTVRPSDAQPVNGTVFASSMPCTLTGDSFIFICSLIGERQYLREVQVCLDRNLVPVSSEKCYFSGNICLQEKPFFYKATL